MENKDEMLRFNNIINLPHHMSKVRKPMSNLNRAAQFSPFAALTGYDAAVVETARLTANRIEVDEETKQKLDLRLNIIQSMQAQSPDIEFTYFVPDEKKSGGEYITVTGQIKKMDSYERRIFLKDGTIIPIDEVIDIDGEIFLSVGIE